MQDLRIKRLTVHQYKWKRRDLTGDYNGFNHVYLKGGEVEFTDYVLTIETEAGITGEYAGGVGVSYAQVAMAAQYLIGKNALEREKIWNDLKRALRKHDKFGMGPIDCALWDIAGKAYGVPVYQMLGGAARDSLRLYTHVGIYQPELMVEDAQRDVADGFTAMKTGAWTGSAGLPEGERIAAFAERIGDLRKAVGPDIGIMVDDHGRGQPSNAVRLMHALEPFDLMFLEEPTQPDDVEGLQRLRLADPQMDLATGERLYSKWDYRSLLEGRFVDVIQPDLCHAGGISEVKKIAAMAESYYVKVAPHNPQGPISTAAAAHLCLAIPNFLILEYVRQEPYRTEAMREEWPVMNGHLHVPDRPGLGVELNEDVLLANPPRLSPTPAAFAADGSVFDI